MTKFGTVLLLLSATVVVNSMAWDLKVEEETARTTIKGENNNCCLCSDCDMMMNVGTDLYDLDQQVFVTCERFAEEIYGTFVAGSDQCGHVQSLFQTPCCLTTADSSQDRRRAWTATSRTTGTTSLTSVPFSSASLTTPPASSTSYVGWNAAQQAPAAGTSAWASAPQRPAATTYTAPAATTTGSSCPQRAGICDFKCPSVPADRLAIYVSIDPVAAGRTDMAYFGAKCGDVQNQMHCVNMLSSDLRCSLLVARFRAECGCGGYQNNAAAFHGGITPSNGAVGNWRIGG
jgi:hypothetical protein